MNRLKQISRFLSGLFILCLLPIIFLMSYAIDSQKAGVFYGIVAYVWLMLTLYATTEPNWINRLFNQYRVDGMMQSLSFVAIVFSVFHTVLTPGRGLVAQTGQLAFMLLIALVFYEFLLIINRMSKSVKILFGLTEDKYDRFKRNLSYLLQKLLLLTNVVIFLHMLLIEQVRNNVVFMLLSVPFSLFIFSTFIYKKIVAVKVMKNNNVIFRRNSKEI